MQNWYEAITIIFAKIKKKIIKIIKKKHLMGPWFGFYILDNDFPKGKLISWSLEYGYFPSSLPMNYSESNSSFLVRGAFASSLAVRILYYLCSWYLSRIYFIAVINLKVYFVNTSGESERERSGRRESMTRLRDTHPRVWYHQVSL